MPDLSQLSKIGFHLLASSSKPSSTKPAGRCGHGYKKGHTKAPENVARALKPKFLEAKAALLT